MTATTSHITWLYWRNRLERALTVHQLAIYDAYLERLVQLMLTERY